MMRISALMCNKINRPVHLHKRHFCARVCVCGGGGGGGGGVVVVVVGGGGGGGVNVKDI